MLPTALLLVLAAALFWAGYLATPALFRFQSRAGVPVFLALAAFTGYLALRERRAVDELAEWIEPPPGITDVRYVPTSGEAQAIAGFLSGVPTGAVASWREGVDGDAVARQTEERQTEYWLVSSRVPLDSIMGLHRANAAARAWRAGTDEPRWMILHRAGDVLSVFATDAWPESGTDILYALTRADGKGRDRTDKTGGDAGPG